MITVAYFALLLIVQIFVVSGQLPLKYFEFTEPTAKSVWKTGTKQTLKWKITGDASTPAKVSLFTRFNIKDTSRNQYKALVLDTENSGTFDWEIPEKFEDGSYQIRICYDSICSGARDSQYPEAGLSAEFKVYTKASNTTDYGIYDLSDAATRTRDLGVAFAVLLSIVTVLLSV